jgi:hypothetical protein
MITTNAWRSAPDIPGALEGQRAVKALRSGDTDRGWHLLQGAISATSDVLPRNSSRQSRTATSSERKQIQTRSRANPPMRTHQLSAWMA